MDAGAALDEETDATELLELAPIELEEMTLELLATTELEATELDATTTFTAL